METIWMISGCNVGSPPERQTVASGNRSFTCRSTDSASETDMCSAEPVLLPRTQKGQDRLQALVNTM